MPKKKLTKRVIDAMMRDEKEGSSYYKKHGLKRLARAEKSHLKTLRKIRRKLR
jgi:hypothetical protein